MENLEGLQKLIRIPSVYDETTASEQTPYGKGIHDALTYMKDVLQKDGFNVETLDEQIIYTSIGEGERIDILNHLDVVSALGEWERDPFSGEVENGYLYGRGSQDMKTPGWLIYLAVKLIRDSGVKLNREIRLVYGSDEERKMDDMKLYCSKADPASFSFTPDGRFPVAIGEKGIMTLFLRGRYHGIINELKSGSSSNTVPDQAECLLRAVNNQPVIEYIMATGMMGEINGTKEGLSIKTYGLASHASQPEKGHSALMDLLCLLYDVYEEKIPGELYDVFHDHYGSGAGIRYQTREMGRLTVNLGALEIKNDEIFGKIDVRYPCGIDPEEITESIRKRLPSFDVKCVYEAPATLVDENDVHVQALLDTYNEVMKTDAKPFISLSGSYAKVVDNCVSMGPVFPDQESGFHNADERISLADCVKCLEIYHKAILKLLDLGYSIDS